MAMNKYLAMLKESEAAKQGLGGFGGALGGASEKIVPSAQGFGGFGGDVGGASQKNKGVERSDTLDPCAGSLMADGPYWPWAPYLTADSLEAMQQAVIKVVTELSRIERWSDEHYDIVVVEVGRQPISTLLPDLDYFRARLDKARAAAATGRKREPR
jgi:hypothetical protein